MSENLARDDLHARTGEGDDDPGIRPEDWIELITKFTQWSIFVIIG
jgi:hypothetical protein